jgi:hypothetical protein
MVSRLGAAQTVPGTIPPRVPPQGPWCAVHLESVARPDHGVRSRQKGLDADAWCA